MCSVGLGLRGVGKVSLVGLKLLEEDEVVEIVNSEQSTS
jgi:hypothetical protein